MPIMKAFHLYQLRKDVQKTSRHIQEIMPVSDMKVSNEMFQEYVDVSRQENKSEH